jgi:hypothetical protein
MDYPKTRTSQMALNREQCFNLAERLHGTTGNLYKIAESVYGIEINDEDFDAIKSHALLFRCEQCSTWTPVDEEDSFMKGMCTQCVDALDE